MSLNIQNLSQLTTLVTNSTAFLQLPVGDTSQRPSIPNVGDTRYNTDTNYLEYYDGVYWQSIDYVERGSAEFVTPGTYTWIVPKKVYAVSVVCIGGGSAGIGNYGAATDVYSGGGGGLGYKNNIAVTPGQTITVAVGNGGTAANTSNSSGNGTYGGAGGDSYFINQSTVCGFGAGASYAGGSYGSSGYPGTGGNYLGDGGSRGENGLTVAYGSADLRGGSAGGYPGSVGSKGISTGSPSGNCGGGGGASLYGSSEVGETGKSGYLVGNSVTGVYYGGDGGKYGGGGGARHGGSRPGVGGNGASGAVRIIWEERAFPNDDAASNENLIADFEYITPGTYQWVAPKDVHYVSVVCVGAGGGGSRTTYGTGGGGGGLGWKNNIPVIPGTAYTLQVGQGSAGDGQPSYFISTSTVAGFGGGTSNNRPKGPGGGYVGDGGGVGGSGAYYGGGGGAGGYTGNGGDGAGSTDDGNPDNGLPSTGGGGGGGGSVPTPRAQGTGGGGVGLYGMGVNGTGGIDISVAAGGGSGGTNSAGRIGGNYGGGAGADYGGVSAVSGSNGAVRIICGTARSFPYEAAASQIKNS